MTTLESLKPPVMENVRIEVPAANQLALSGSIALREPSACLSSFFRQVHDTASGEMRAVRVDVSGLTFVNSSAIRLFVDWTTWIKREPDTRRYELRFITNQSITWQRTTFAALRSLASGIVTVDP